MQNPGKQFEAEWKASVPSWMFFYRFRDGTASWGGNDETRFQQSNICDCMIYNLSLYLIELKSHAGKSLPLSAIRQNQLVQLEKAITYPGITAGFVVNFRDVPKTFFASADRVAEFVRKGERKSIPIAWFKENGVEIQGKKLKVHYRWDVEEFLSEGIARIDKN